MASRRTTTKDVALLKQLHEGGQLELAAEFQRNSVWPRPAKAYLIDTILADRPIPLIFMQRHASAQTGRPTYTVIDGQQRLRAVFEFLDNRFPLTQSSNSDTSNKRFSDLKTVFQEQILNYDLIVEELSGYREADIRDMFVRINKYVVSLSPQELRHAKESGAFYTFVEDWGARDFWRVRKVFTPLQLRRMRAVELAAELAILLIEGPQDKKSSIDLYYGAYQQDFPFATDVTARLERYLDWIVTALPDLEKRRFRRPVDLYSLVGALDRRATAGKGGRIVTSPSPEDAGPQLAEFERQLRRKRPPADANRYLLAASRQTDNLRPRQTRMEIIGTILDGI